MCHCTNIAMFMCVLFVCVYVLWTNRIIFTDLTGWHRCSNFKYHWTCMWFSNWNFARVSYFWKRTKHLLFKDWQLIVMATDWQQLTRQFNDLKLFKFFVIYCIGVLLYYCSSVLCLFNLIGIVQFYWMYSCCFVSDNQMTVRTFEAVVHQPLHRPVIRLGRTRTGLNRVLFASHGVWRQPATSIQSLSYVKSNACWT